MGVALGVAVLVLSLALVVLMAASEWFDLDFSHASKASLALPARSVKGAKRKRR